MNQYYSHHHTMSLSCTVMVVVTMQGISKGISERTSCQSTVKHNSELLPVLLSPIIYKALGDILVEYFK